VLAQVDEGEGGEDADADGDAGEQAGVGVEEPGEG